MYPNIEPREQLLHHFATITLSKTKCWGTKPVRNPGRNQWNIDSRHRYSHRRFIVYSSISLWARLLGSSRPRKAAEALELEFRSQPNCISVAALEMKLRSVLGPSLFPSTCKCHPVEHTRCHPRDFRTCSYSTRPGAPRVLATFYHARPYGWHGVSGKLHMLSELVGGSPQPIIRVVVQLRAYAHFVSARICRWGIHAPMLSGQVCWQELSNARIKWSPYCVKLDNCYKVIGIIHIFSLFRPNFAGLGNYSVMLSDRCIWISTSQDFSAYLWWMLHNMHYWKPSKIYVIAAMVLCSLPFTVARPLPCQDVRSPDLRDRVSFTVC